MTQINLVQDMDVVFESELKRERVCVRGERITVDCATEASRA